MINLAEMEYCPGCEDYKNLETDHITCNRDGHYFCFDCGCEFEDRNIISRKKILNRGKSITYPDNVCFNCLSRFDDKHLHTIVIPPLGYGSRFDGFGTKMVLCNDCYAATEPDWWKLSMIEQEPYYVKYEHEDEILNFVDSLPVEGQELFRNRFGTISFYMDPQDWIDYHLNILSSDKYEEYGFSIRDRLIENENIKNIIDSNIVKPTNNIQTTEKIIIEALVELIKKERGL